MKNKSIIEKPSSIWLEFPEEHDYPAAMDYLELLFKKPQAKKLTDELQHAEMTVKKAKDILRASGLPMLPKSNVHVKANIKKARSGKKLSPVLLVRSSYGLIIADGYHRVCAIYYLSEDLVIPCKIA